MLENANTSNNMMAEYSNSPNSRTSPAVSPDTTANSHTVKINGSNRGIISEYSSGQKPNSEKSVSPAEAKDSKVSSESGAAQNKMNTATSPTQTDANKNDVKDSYIKGQGCTPNRSKFPAETPVTMAYVPFQHIGKTYSPEDGLNYGTIFPDLNKPFLGGGMKK